MASCKKNTEFPLLNGGSLLSRNIQYTSDRKTIQVILTGSSLVECTTDIDAADFVGVKIMNNNLVFTDAISGLNNDINSSVSNNPRITIAYAGNVLNIIGIDDTANGFSVTRLNVRYDSATNTVKYQI